MWVMQPLCIQPAVRPFVLYRHFEPATSFVALLQDPLKEDSHAVLKIVFPQSSSNSGIPTVKGQIDLVPMAALSRAVRILRQARHVDSM